MESEKPTFESVFRKHLAGKLAGDGKYAPPKPQPEKVPPTPGLRVLMTVPWLLGILFLISFVWDFEGVRLSTDFVNLQFEGLLRILSVSGLIGFLTNWIAISMLFYPRKRRPLLGQGLIPAQKDRIAKRLSAAVERELINPELVKREFVASGLLNRYTDLLIWDVKSLMDNPEFRDDVSKLMHHYIQEAFADPAMKARIVDEAEQAVMESVKGRKVEQTALKMYLIMRGKTLREFLMDATEKLPAKMARATEPIDELLNTIPARMRKDRAQLQNLFLMVINGIVDKIEVQKIIETNINSYDEGKLEAIIRGASDTQLRYIKYLGAVIGFGGGFVIWQPVLSLAVLITAGLLIWLADRILGGT
ncbi:Protein of unknown function (DUF445) [Cyclonatronum proteinivorum]|uniref:DUF445 family protein n=1 Tax=Cyclonatronum proteinivorum TaxID=1457365 RepID=A0A345UKS0_9BACT|nr:DUF445 family protein [Cyclonatronum proteinivorum]AXJ01072.1 Protein of unknown function (DUF445) [Cyclonatronum proteinivorum]